MTTTSPYQHFLTLDTSVYQEGEYLVLVDDQVVRHGRELKEMLEAVKESYPGKTPYIAKVPGEQVMVLVVSV